MDSFLSRQIITGNVLKIEKKNLKLVLLKTKIPSKARPKNNMSNFKRSLKRL